MAFLRKRPHSPFWTLRSRDLDTGAWTDRSTKYRRDSASDTRAARRMAEETTQAEARWMSEAGNKDKALFRLWVTDYIGAHYRRPASLRRYELAWNNLRAFLAERKVTHPRQVRYEHASDYLAWRTKQGASQNTARLEIKFLAFLLNEAIRRDYCEKNPIALAKVPRTPSAPRPDLEADDLLRARAAFAHHPQWMRTVFEMMLHLGCRFAETSIPLENIDLTRDIIHLIDSKRADSDPRKLYAVPLPANLRPYLIALKNSGKTRTVPVLTREDNRRFNIVLKEATAGATSHSLRVAFISRCHRAGLTELQAMRLVNHSTQLVHRIYSRLGVEDVRAAMAAMPQPVPPPDLPESPAPSAASSCARKKGSRSASKR